MKTMQGILGLFVLVALMFSVVGCEAMPVTMSPFASYGGTGIDYPTPGRSDPNHQWQVGMSASFVLGARGVVPNAVPTPSLPTVMRVDNSSSNQNNATNSASNSNNNSNSNSNNNQTINGGIH